MKLNLKNPTPRQIALFTAIMISFITILITLVLQLVFYQAIHWNFLLLAAAVVFICAYLSFLYALKTFIYRRIKLIYKTIHHLKQPKNGVHTKMDMQEHIIDEVEKEVFNWAKDQRNEIDYLKNLEAYRRDFLGNISHELKTPIFNIQGYIDTLIEGGMDDKQINVRYLKRAATNVERLNNIIEDLDVISQLEVDALHLDLEKFDIRNLSIEIFEDLEFKAEDRNIQLAIKDGCNHPFFVYADRERIRQVLVNLISNSIKYGKKDGMTQVGFYNMEENILIEVSDDGLGIDEKHLPRLFERFYRVDKSRSRSQGGTGLGLSIVKHLIEAHNQTINVRSSINVGSTFGFTLKSA